MRLDLEIISEGAQSPPEMDTGSDTNWDTESDTMDDDSRARDVEDGQEADDEAENPGEVEDSPPAKKQKVEEPSSSTNPEGVKQQATTGYRSPFRKRLRVDKSGEYYCNVHCIILSEARS